MLKSINLMTWKQSLEVMHFRILSKNSKVKSEGNHFHQNLLCWTWSVQLEISDLDLYLIYWHNKYDSCSWHCILFYCFKFTKASNPVGCEQTLTSLINWECFQLIFNLLHFITVSVYYNNVYLSVVYCVIVFSPVNKKPIFFLF